MMLYDSSGSVVGVLIGRSSLVRPVSLSGRKLVDVTVTSPGKRLLNNIAFLAMLIVLPAIPWYVTIAIRYYDGALVVPNAAFISHIAAPTLSTCALYLAWLVFQIGLAWLLPGRIVAGAPLEGGRSLDYKLNGLTAYLLTLGAVASLVSLDVVEASFLYDQLDAFVTTTNLVVLGLCFVMYAIGRRQASPKEKLLNPIEAYFVGATLNPRTGSLDWKFVCESRPGMILWVLLDVSFAAAQLAKHGHISSGMWLVCAFQILYVTDYFVLEEAILTTWDIRHEPFGFMLCWGCLVWIPFTFSLQALYLVDHAVALPAYAIAGIVLLNMTGYLIFRGANLQKHRFRKGSRELFGWPAQYIQTKHGTKLLTSGFWGIARHSNYLGDLMMGLAWCLATGFSSVLSYFYFIYFVILLVHRERRDNDHCARKYGADWEEYTRKVPWRILPFVY
jgi:protein-S-isoprenylcysteine O-methyltransferase Ste14